MPECHNCGNVIRVPDGFDFTEGVDVCWDCERDSLTARVRELEGMVRKYVEGFETWYPQHASGCVCTGGIACVACEIQRINNKARALLEKKEKV